MYVSVWNLIRPILCIILRTDKKKWLLSSNGPLQFGQSVLLDKKSLDKCAVGLLASFLN